MSLITKVDFDALRLELSVKAKNGINFMLAAAVVWLLISYVWTLPYEPKQKCIITFYVGAVMLPLAWIFSRILRTSWTLPDNPLQPLGLWLNFAQLVYFPILFFVFWKYPQHFLMVYIVITGAHFLPYAWFYNTRAYAFASVVISIGAVWLELTLAPELTYLKPLLLSAALLVLAGWLAVDYQGKKKAIGVA